MPFWNDKGRVAYRFLKSMNFGALSSKKKAQTNLDHCRPTFMKSPLSKHTKVKYWHCLFQWNSMNLINISYSAHLELIQLRTKCNSKIINSYWVWSLFCSWILFDFTVSIYASNWKYQVACLIFIDLGSDKKYNIKPPNISSWIQFCGLFAFPKR